MTTLVPTELLDRDRDTLMLMWCCGPFLTFIDIGGRLTAAGLVANGSLTELGHRTAAELVLADPGCTVLAKEQARAELARTVAR